MHEGYSSDNSLPILLLWELYKHIKKRAKQKQCAVNMDMVSGV